jgi:hypothetical protein
MRLVAEVDALPVVDEGRVRFKYRAALRAEKRLELRVHARLVDAQGGGAGENIAAPGARERTCGTRAQKYYTSAQ